MRPRTDRSRLDRRLRSRWQRERRRQRIAIILGVVIILIILAIPAYGYYSSFIVPPRVWAARVRNTTITMGDLVKMVRTLQSAGRAFGGVDMAVAPFEVLFTMVESELIRQAAPNFGITVTEADIDKELRDRFYPKVPEGQEADKDQLEREFKERYRNFLTSTRLSDKEYRRVLMYDAYRSRMREELGKRAPSVVEQVEVYWIRLPIDTNAEEVKQRLEEGEDFSKVAKELSTESYYADDNGYVGWVPKGAFPNLDKFLFGDEETQPLEHNKVSDPIPTQLGTYLIKVVAGPEVREVDNKKMQEKLKDEALKAWVQEEWKEAGVEVNFDDKWYAWVAKQVEIARPRSPQGG
jgi:foldase protein PrsA